MCQTAKSPITSLHERAKLQKTAYIRGWL
ncbi:hypothetical protein J1605_009255 [Eschrichtius robustus]|uniref:Uncharacterized protein n=1 Tax=Eschrichtius robustus TaxID=9764 RepID=A0AB34GX87_ESCRO|nr:hypothetical protein J1605_009255 [Eschrichtius robustus]